ncbi:MAG: Rhomboid family protein [Verrucomicrobiales bacterium]|nr:Rhomboid family protein [Verrucomicrobiales bacterium]
MVSAAFILALLPQSVGWLQYDRSAILSAQLWRLFTGHWIHFSMSHLLYDAGAVGIAGWIIEQNRRPDFKWYCLLAPWVIGLACFIFAPRMEFYGGLSGIATGLLVYMALQGLRERTAWRWICTAILCSVPLKIYCESTAGQTLFASGMDQHIAVCITSHVAGALSALGWVTMVNCQKTFRLRNVPC